MECCKVKKTGCVLIQLVLFLGFLSYARAETAVVDRIVAVVNGEIITLSEFKRFESLVYMGSPEKPAAGADRKLLEQMIEKRLIRHEAKKLKIEVKEKEVDTAIEEILERNKISLDMLKANLKMEGTTFQEYRELLKSEILQSQVIGREVQSRINITDKEFEEYYEQSIKPGEKPGARVRIQQIVLLAPKGSTADQAAVIEKNIAGIREKIIGGESFGQMAATFSQGSAARTGGDLGYFHKGELLPEIEKAAFSMEKEELSPVIRTSMGFHLIKVLDKDETAQDRSWQDHADEINRALYNRMYEERFKEWMQSLKKKSYIDIKY
jgi:peptidyl-prolyl cis-trans isomerase SurA